MTKRNDAIAILGCGWVGLELGRSLRARGLDVLGSTTRPERLADLRAAGITPFVIDLNGDSNESEIGGHLSKTFSDTTTFWNCPRLVITVPPQAQTTGEDGLSKVVAQALSLWRARDARAKVVFTSSVSVYGSRQGAVDERDDANPSEIGGRACRAAECILSADDRPWAAIRLGGLFGPERNPARYLAGRRELSEGSAPVNLIHRLDVLGILERILESDGPAGVGLFNAVIPDQSTRRDFYARAVRDLGLEPPSFLTETPPLPTYKRVLSQRLLAELGYEFQVSSFNRLLEAMRP